jgi:hypothetical protein
MNLGSKFVIIYIVAVAFLEFFHLLDTRIKYLYLLLNIDIPTYEAELNQKNPESDEADESGSSSSSSRPQDLMIIS